MRIGISTAIALAIIAPPLAAEQPATLPNWMAGAWIQTEGDAWAEEFWTPARGGMMIGTGRNGRGAKLTGWEMMRIEQDGEGREQVGKDALGSEADGDAADPEASDQRRDVDPQIVEDDDQRDREHHDVHEDAD